MVQLPESGPQPTIGPVGYGHRSVVVQFLSDEVVVSLAVVVVVVVDSVVVTGVDPVEDEVVVVVVVVSSPGADVGDEDDDEGDGVVVVVVAVDSEAGEVDEPLDVVVDPVSDGEVVMVDRVVVGGEPIARAVVVGPSELDARLATLRR